MITDKSLQVRDFYNKHPFPGPYTAQMVKEYEGQNRYISFISKAITHSRNVLDAGCGTGFISNYLAKIYPTKKFTAVDFADSIYYADKVKKQLKISNLEFIKQDLIRFETKKNFDTIICQGVLHHIPDFKQVLLRLKTMMSGNGIFIIGLYHPWGKALQKWMPNNYHNKTLEIDQEKHPFELCFWKKDVKKMFAEYKLVASSPGVLFNWKNGGLTTYIFKK